MSRVGYLNSLTSADSKALSAHTLRAFAFQDRLAARLAGRAWRAAPKLARSKSEGNSESPTWGMARP